MEVMDITERVKEFVTANFYVEPASLAVDASLLEQGIVDSTGVLEVVSFLEAEFGIAVADEELLPENLDTIDRISAFVARKKALRT
jgi:acyl carrier protein